MTRTKHTARKSTGANDVCRSTWCFRLLVTAFLVQATLLLWVSVSNLAFSPPSFTGNGLLQALPKFASNQRSSSVTSRDLASSITVVVKSMHAGNPCWQRLLGSLSGAGINLGVIAAFEEEAISSLDMASLPANVHVVPIGHDAGLSAGRNLLVSLVRTPYLLLFDDDFLLLESVDYAALLREMIDALDSGLFDLIGGCASVGSCASYLMHKEGDRELVITPQEWTGRARFRVDPADMVDNFFLARVSSLKNVLWDEDLKLGEHEDFFIRAQGKISIGFFAPLAIANDRACREADRLVSNELALYKRSRVFNYWKAGLTKHGIVRLKTIAGQYEVECEGSQGAPSFAAFQTGMDRCTLHTSTAWKDPWGTRRGFTPDRFPPLAQHLPLRAGEPCQARIAIMTVAIGRYIEFIPDLWASVKKFFLPGCPKELFLFTDDLKHAIGDDPAVHLVGQHRLGWPYDSLMRFEMYKTQQEELESRFQYVYAVDSDALFTAAVGKEVLVPSVATLSAWYHGRARALLPFDANPQSSFFVRSNQGRMYFAGGFYGGEVAHVVRLWNTVVPQIRMSLDVLRYTPPWDDESVLNHWFNVVAPPHAILGPHYLLPEPPTDFWLSHEQQLFYKTEAYSQSYRPGMEPKLLNLGTRKATDKTLRVSKPIHVESPAVASMEISGPLTACSSGVPLQPKLGKAQTHCMHWVPGKLSPEERANTCRKFGMGECSASDIAVHVRFGTPVCLPVLLQEQDGQCVSLVGDTLNYCGQATAGSPSGSVVKSKAACDSLATPFCCSVIEHL